MREHGVVKIVYQFLGQMPCCSFHSMSRVDRTGLPHFGIEHLQQPAIIPRTPCRTFRATTTHDTGPDDRSSLIKNREDVTILGEVGAVMSKLHVGVGFFLVTFVAVQMSTRQDGSSPIPHEHRMPFATHGSTKIACASVEIPSRQPSWADPHSQPLPSCG
jgi:hypothetical protein